MTTNWDVLNTRYQIYFYGFCGEHYDIFDDTTKANYIYMVPYSVPAHQIYRCCKKDCDNYIKHTDKGKIHFVHGNNPCPPR